MEHALELNERMGMFGAMFVNNRLAYIPATAPRRICTGDNVAHKRIFVPEMLHRREIESIQKV